MTKNDIISKVCMNTGFSKRMVTQITDELLNCVTEELKDGGSVTFIGFGTFKTKKTAERPGRNPKTGEDAVIPSRRIPLFKPGKYLKEAMLDSAE